MRPRPRTPAGRALRRALKVSLLYALFATRWILLSDAVVEFLIPPGSFRTVQTVKGILFVAATTAVLYGALHRAYREETLETIDVSSLVSSDGGTRCEVRFPRFQQNIV